MIKKLSPAQKTGVRDALLSSALYGLGFIVTKLALETWSPLGVTFMRVFIAAFGGIVFLAITKQLPLLRSHWKIAVIPGFVLSVELFLISWGLSGTSVSSGVFIANTYVVFVPLFLGMSLFSKKGLHHLFFISIALLGVVLVSGFERVSLSNYGDFICLLTSFVTAGHIVTVQKAASKVSSPGAFNICQCVWGTMYLAAGLVLFDGGDLHSDSSTMVWLYVLCSGLVSTLIATMYQVSSQKKVGAAASSLLFMSDAPFGAIFGMILLSESFSGLQFAGAVTIFLAALGQFSIDWKSDKKSTSSSLDESQPVVINEDSVA